MDENDKELDGIIVDFGTIIEVDILVPILRVLMSDLDDWPAHEIYIYYLLHFQGKIFFIFKPGR